MSKYLFKSLLFSFFVAAAFLLTSKAQAKVCDLQIKTFSYNALPSTKSFIENVEVSLTNLKTKEKKILTTNFENTIFENLSEGNYKVVLVKKGYKKKSKEVNLDCSLTDKDNGVYENIYLWRDEKSSDDLADLREYKSDVAKSNNEISGDSIKSESQADTKKIYGKVTLQLLIDEDGNVVSAKMIDGNELLKDSTIKAARRSKFLPTLLAGIAVKVKGDITYNFVP